MRRLAESRKAIDALDLQLLELLNRRTRVVEEIGRAKESIGLPIYEPKRETDVFRNVTDHNQGPLTTDAVKSIFERIIDEMRTLQKMRRQQREQGEKEC
jgi:chorismate mutase/prephenate dehydratase